jgi:hypothetical protein
VGPIAGRLLETMKPGVEREGNDLKVIDEN